MESWNTVYEHLSTFDFFFQAEHIRTIRVELVEVERIALLDKSFSVCT